MFAHLASCSRPASICRRRWSPGFRMSQDCWDDDAWPCSANLAHRETARGHRPWPRADRRATTAGSRRSRRSPAGNARCSAFGAMPPPVHMALLDDDDGPGRRAEPMPAKTGHFPSVGVRHPPAIRLERAIHDLFGLQPIGCARHAAMARPRLLGRRAAARRRTPAQKPEPYAFLPAEGESLHQIRGRPGPCRHHRAGSFPLHRERRARGAARAAARLRRTRASSC